MLSAQTQDRDDAGGVDAAVPRRRARRATMARLTVKQIERLIYPVSFYRHKATHVKATCRILVERFGGRVPATMEELLTLPGVGRKTANLVLILVVQEPRRTSASTRTCTGSRTGSAGCRRERRRKPSRRSTRRRDERWWPYINCIW